MCPVVGYSVNDKSPLADLDTLLSTPAGPGLSHVRMALARLAVSDCAPQTSRVSSNLHSSSSMAVSRVPSPPPPEVNTPVAENWCYTQVRFVVGGSLSSAWPLRCGLAIDSPAPKFTQSP
ncbi:hypothetical protein PUN28_013724 [Cardiocondyla obscurior]|uniref:Protein roadkill n=1 Tax=Cardiocondyla obscurior TaxID=286306 RepID=A0AAW2F583_9HYME